MQPAQDQEAGLGSSGCGDFTTTQWSVVLASAETRSSQAAQALEALCRAYWQPLYAYVRRQGHPPEEAQDLTQEFFQRLLSTHLVGKANPACGKFRNFLLTSLKHFLVSEWRKTERKKRGGGQLFVPWDTHAAEQCHAAEPRGELTSEDVYQRRWAITLMERVLARLREEYYADGKHRLFDALKHRVWGDESLRPYAEIAATLGLTEEGVKTSVHRLRSRCREVLRAEVAQTVVRPEEIDEELHHLIGVFSE